MGKSWGETIYMDSSKIVIGGLDVESPRGLSEDLFRVKAEALLEIFKDLLLDGWDTIKVNDEDDVWVYYFTKESGGKTRRIRMGEVDAAVKWAHEEIYETGIPDKVGWFNYTYGYDPRKYGFQGELGSDDHGKFMDEVEEKLIWADRPVREFKPSKHLIKYYYSKGFSMRIKTKGGRKYLYAMKTDPKTGKIIKRNLGIKS
jgi:ribosomal protein L34